MKKTQSANSLSVAIEISGAKTQVGIGTSKLIPVKLKEDVVVIGALCLR